MENIKKNKIIYIFICIIIVILCVIILFFLDKKDASSEGYNYLEISEESINSNTTENNNTEVQNNIYIHIMGEVKNPGVVIAKEGDRIKDIIEKAGGTTEKADLKNINLAYKVEDGKKINIPNIDENKNENGYRNPGFLRKRGSLLRQLRFKMGFRRQIFLPCHPPCKINGKYSVLVRFSATPL